MATRRRSTTKKKKGKPRGRNGGLRKANATSFGQKDGNKGNTTGIPGPGRPPQTFVRRMQVLAERAAQAARWEKLLSDDNTDHGTFFAAFDRVSDRGFGRAAQPVDVTLPPPTPLTEAEREARIAALVAKRAGK